MYKSCDLMLFMYDYFLVQLLTMHRNSYCSAVHWEIVGPTNFNNLIIILIIAKYNGICVWTCIARNNSYANDYSYITFCL